MAEFNLTRPQLFSRELKKLLTRWARLDEGERIDALAEFSRLPDGADLRLRDVVKHLDNTLKGEKP